MVHLCIDLFTDDFNHVLRRSTLAGVKSMIITGGSLNESRAAVQLAEKHSQFERFTIFLV